jgi:EAL domain-containing protein (putative c-di-GMP-specific phosphodiesterase class I)
LQVIQDLEIGAAQGYLLGRPNASVEATYVDVQQLASGLVVPAGARVSPDTTAPDAAVEAVQHPVRQNETRLGSAVSPA